MARYSRIHLGPARKNDPQVREAVAGAAITPGCLVVLSSGKFVLAGASTIGKVWLAQEGEGGTWGPTLRPAFGGLRPSVEEQLARAKTFTAKNAAYLAKAGIPINKASLYAAHFFGSVTAAKVIGADVGASAEALAGPAATKANPSILKGKTVGDFLSWLHNKTGDWAR